MPRVGKLAAGVANLGKLAAGVADAVRAVYCCMPLAAKPATGVVECALLGVANGDCSDGANYIPLVGAASGVDVGSDLPLSSSRHSALLFLRSQSM